MIRDDELHNSLDYSVGQREAAHRILVELANLFNAYKDDIRIVGGWVPDLMFPNEGHIGSVDVDVLINHVMLRDSGYQSMAKILLENGYVESPEKYFSFVKDVVVDDITYAVDVDVLAGMYGGTQIKKRSQHVQGMKALKATGGNFAFNFKPQEILVEAKRPDGAMDVAHINIVAVAPYLVMKTAAMGRGKAKDAYDIYFLLKHYAGGVKLLSKEFDDCRNLPIINEMKQKLLEKFASENHAGPVDVSDFLNIEDKEEIEMTRRDAYEQVKSLLKSL